MYVSRILRKFTVANLFQRSFRLKNRLESVIQDLENDTLIEIASGVAQVNSSVKQIIANLAQNRIGNLNVGLC